jgi:hypothetical protein
VIRFLTLFVFCTVAHAQTEHVGRYTRLRPTPISLPLDTPVAARFVSAASVQDAVRLVLQPTGYQLAGADYAPALQPTLLRMPLPTSHRDFTGHRAIDALVALAKPGYRVVVDHVHRLIAFEPRPRYRHYAVRAIAAAATVGHRDNTDAAPTSVGAWRCVRVGAQHRCVAGPT